MSTQVTIRKVIAAAAISTAIGLSSLVSGSASADVPMIYQALTSNEQIKGYWSSQPVVPSDEKLTVHVEHMTRR